MPPQWDPDCQKALALAQQALADDEALDVPLVLAALFHAGGIGRDEKFADLSAILPEPKPQRPDVPESVLVARDLRPIFESLNGQPVTARRLFDTLLNSPAGHKTLQERGVPDDRYRTLVGGSGGPVPAPPPAPPKLQALRMFGTVLTELPGPVVDPGMLRPALLQKLTARLLVPRARSVLLISPPGTGKTALIQHLARRRLDQPDQLPQALRQLELFTLSADFPRLPSDTSMELNPATGLQRVRQLFHTLQDHPQVVLVIHNFLPFFAALYNLSVHQELVEGFKWRLEAGLLTCIGCLLPEQMDQLKPLDPALARHFRLLHLPSLSPEETVGVLQARRPALEKHFAQVRIPDEPGFLRRVVELTEEHLRDRYQPEKSLRLLEDACACAVTGDPSDGPRTVGPQHLLDALGRAVGNDNGSRSLADFFGGADTSPIERVWQSLRAKIVGQDEVLRGIAGAFVAGLADQGWVLRESPRGVLLFGGPTGVGKTETALLLSRLLGSPNQALIRVDCQNFQGGGTGHEANTLMWRLLGVAPGYVGYTPGCKDGLLVRVRDCPAAVLLLDEFDKADPAVGKLFLRILDEGKALDSEGNELDFRRCLVILTTNAGVTYHDRDKPIFGFAERLRQSAPTLAADVSRQALYDELRTKGLGMEFLARIHHVFLFRALNVEAIRTIVERQLDSVRFLAKGKGFELEWAPDVVGCLVNAWDPVMGARHMANLLRACVLDPLNVAAAQKRLTTVRRIRIEIGDSRAERLQQDGEVLTIRLGPDSVPAG
jgi:ATP-dependent Clp protease ATP-binding subunit ClpA